MGYLAYFLIDVDVTASPIAGHIASDQDERRPFHGWLELSSAIEQRRTAGISAAELTGASAAPLPSEPDGDRLQLPGAGANGCGPRAGALSDERAPSFRRRGVGPWLAQCTQPQWMLLGAWTCAGWSAIAVPVLAATRHTRVVAWWALGLLAILVLLTFLWTERRLGIDPDDHDQGPPRGPPAPSRDRGWPGIDCHRLDQDVASPPTQRPAVRCPGRSPLRAFPAHGRRPGI